MEKKTAENLLLSLQSYFLSVTKLWDEQSWFVSAAGRGWDLKMYPQEKTEQAELRGRERTKPRLLALNLEFLFGLLLVVFQVMPKIPQQGPAVAAVLC